MTPTQNDPVTFEEWRRNIQAGEFDRRIGELLEVSRQCDERALQALGDES